jgi:hypothetical protein
VATTDEQQNGARQETVVYKQGHEHDLVYITWLWNKIWKKNSLSIEID